MVLKRSLALVSRWWLVAVLAGIVAVTNQYWVGGATVYAEHNRERQAEAHEAILANELPAGVESWSSIGANGTAVRVLAVWSASALQGLTGWNLRRVYFVQDSVMLFLALVLIFLFFQGVAATNLAFVGMLYVAAVLPLTYFLHWFHPWDRPSLVLWALALLLLQRQCWVLLGVTLVVGVLVKYDIMIFPLWVLFAEFNARKPFRAFAIAGTLATVTFGTYAALVYLIPGAIEPGAKSMMSQVLNNLQVLSALGPAYPPLLALALPTLFALAGFRRADQFAKAGVLFCLAMTVIMFLRSNFAEFRAEMPLLLSLAPAALYGIRFLERNSLIKE